MKIFLVAAASLGFSIAAASACDFHNTSASAGTATTDSMTVASIATPPMSKATGAAAEKLAEPDIRTPAKPANPVKQ